MSGGSRSSCLLYSHIEAIVLTHFGLGVVVVNKILCFWIKLFLFHSVKLLLAAQRILEENFDYRNVLEVTLFSTSLVWLKNRTPYSEKSFGRYISEQIKK